MQKAKALYSNIADLPNELSFCQGDVLTVIEQNLKGIEGWWICTLNGKCGIVPGNRLALMPTSPTLARPGSLRKNSRRKNSKRVTFESDPATQSSILDNESRMNLSRDHNAAMLSSRGHHENTSRNHSMTLPHPSSEARRRLNRSLDDTDIYDIPRKEFQDYDIPPPARPIPKPEATPQTLNRNTVPAVQIANNVNICSINRDPRIINSLLSNETIYDTPSLIYSSDRSPHSSQSVTPSCDRVQIYNHANQETRSGFTPSPIYSSDRSSHSSPSITPRSDQVHLSNPNYETGSGFPPSPIYSSPHSSHSLSPPSDRGVYFSNDTNYQGTLPVFQPVLRRSPRLEQPNCGLGQDSTYQVPRKMVDSGVELILQRMDLCGGRNFPGMSPRSTDSGIYMSTNNLFTNDDVIDGKFPSGIPNDGNFERIYSTVEDNRIYDIPAQNLNNSSLGRGDFQLSIVDTGFVGGTNQSPQKRGTSQIDEFRSYRRHICNLIDKLNELLNWKNLQLPKIIGVLREFKDVIQKLVGFGSQALQLSMETGNDRLAEALLQHVEDIQSLQEDFEHAVDKVMARIPNEYELVSKDCFAQIVSLVLTLKDLSKNFILCVSQNSGIIFDGTAAWKSLGFFDDVVGTGLSGVNTCTSLENVAALQTLARPSTNGNVAPMHSLNNGMNGNCGFQSGQNNPTRRPSYPQNRPLPPTPVERVQPSCELIDIPVLVEREEGGIMQGRYDFLQDECNLNESLYASIADMNTKTLRA